MSRKKKCTVPHDTELCKAQSRTFYKDVQGKMVYITVTIQDIPRKAAVLKNSCRSVGEYMKLLADVVDAL